MLEPKSKTLLTLFGDSSNDKYYVPNFQRDFAWGSEQIDDLWRDLRNPDQEGVFLGHLILHRKSEDDDAAADGEGLAIIDGQQRLTTLSLLIVACRDYARKKKLHEHVVDLQRLLAFTNRATLKVEGLRLKVGKNISNIYSYMVEDERWEETSFPARANGAAMKRESNRIKPLYEFFEKELAELNTNDFIKLKEAIYGCYFIVLEISDRSQAFDIFERTNARGVPLNIADLLKNLLFSREDLKTLDSKWTEIVERAGISIQRMIKYYASLHHELVRKKELYRKLRGTVLTLQTSDFIESLSRFSAFYKYCLNAGDIDEFNTMLDIAGFANIRGNVAYCKSVKKSIDALHFFGITQATPVIYAGLSTANRLEEPSRSAPLNKLFVEVITAIEKYHFVNNVICTNVGHDIEVLYAKKSKSLYHCPSAAEFKTLCKELVADLSNMRDKRENFVSKFADIVYDPTPYTLGLISYIFDRFQNQGESGAQVRDIFVRDPKIFMREYSIDHFWEQSKKESFDGTPEQIDNIGNLNVLPRHTNSDDLNGLNPAEKAALLRERHCEGLKYVKDFLAFYDDAGGKWTGEEVDRRAIVIAEKGFDEVWAM